MPEKANNTNSKKSRQLQRRLCPEAKRKYTNIFWSDIVADSLVKEYAGNSLVCTGSKWIIGKPCAGKPHARFEVAGDGNQEGVDSQAPFLAPTTRTRLAKVKSMLMQVKESFVSRLSVQ